jgi:hypothetical protein
MSKNVARLTLVGGGSEALAMSMSCLLRPDAVKRGRYGASTKMASDLRATTAALTPLLSSTSQLPIN